MSAISYILSVGQTLEQVTVGTAAPTSGSIEIRMDTTAAAVTDPNAPGGVSRPVKKSEHYEMLLILLQQLARDVTFPVE